MREVTCSSPFVMNLIQQNLEQPLILITRNEKKHYIKHYLEWRHCVQFAICVTFCGRRSLALPPMFALNFYHNNIEDVHI